MKYILILLISIVFTNDIKAQFYHDFYNSDTTKMFPPSSDSKDISFDNYMKKLNHAINTKNTKELLPLLDSNIKCSFGGDWGWSGFIRMWHPDIAKSGVWTLLRKMIDIGGQYDSGQQEWVYPYVFNLSQKYDAFFSFVIIGKNRNLRVSPDLNSKIIAKLSYDIVTYDTIGGRKDPDTNHLNPWGEWEWYNVTTLDGKYSGYVNW